MKRITSLLLVMLFLLSLVPTALAVAAPAPAEEETPAEVVNSDTQWSYWDQETDPVINSEMYQKYPIRFAFSGPMVRSWEMLAGRRLLVPLVRKTAPSLTWATAAPPRLC